MSTTQYIAIDPGASGGIAGGCGRLGMTRLMSMPSTMPEVIEQLRSLYYDNYRVAFIERVGAMPHDGKASLWKFAFHCGGLHAALIAIGFSVREVTPKEWQSRIIGVAGCKDKPERKRLIKEAMQKQYPEHTITLKTSDACGIFSWASERM